MLSKSSLNLPPRRPPSVMTVIEFLLLATATVGIAVWLLLPCI